MKKAFLIVFAIVTLVGCTKEDIGPTPTQPELAITKPMGIKLATAFVTSEVAMNVKADEAGTVTIKIFDISNRVVSKETLNVSIGDNILKVYTSALPSSAYRIGIYNASGAMLGITDFNKL